MTNKGLKRGLLLIIGILSVMVIVLTQSFYKPLSEEKAKTEQSDSKNKDTIHAPSDVVANGNTLALNTDQAVASNGVAVSEEPKKVVVAIRQGLFKFFRTLFRTSIAPNAP